MPRIKFEVRPLDSAGSIERVSYQQAVQLVNAGDARWVTGKRSLQRLRPTKSGWALKLSDGYAILQLL